MIHVELKEQGFKPITHAIPDIKNGKYYLSAKERYPIDELTYKRLINHPLYPLFKTYLKDDTLVFVFPNGYYFSTTIQKEP